MNQELVIFFLPICIESGLILCWIFCRELELTVEDLRGHVINKRTRVNMADVENMALILSKSRYGN